MRGEGRCPTVFFGRLAVGVLVGTRAYDLVRFTFFYSKSTTSCAGHQQMGGRVRGVRYPEEEEDDRAGRQRCDGSADDAVPTE